MPDPKQIPFLLKLIDDHSETVRKLAEDALAAFGPSLVQHLSKLTEPPDTEQMEKIRNLLKEYSSSESSSPETVVAVPLFQPGQLVQHKRYHYRGVVVAFDPNCQADDNPPWYVG